MIYIQYNKDTKYVSSIVAISQARCTRYEHRRSWKDGSTARIDPGQESQAILGDRTGSFGAIAGPRSIAR